MIILGVCQKFILQSEIRNKLKNLQNISVNINKLKPDSNSRIVESNISEGESMDIYKIMTHLPHRYPFLMIDRIVNIIPNESAIGLKFVSSNEPFFTGHFPGNPVMPGVLIVEAMGQTATAFMGRSINLNSKSHLVYMRSINDTKFKNTVLPGSCLELHLSLIRKLSELWQFKGIAKVGNTIMAECKFSAVIREKHNPD